jgi:hypothetical protein
MWKSAKNGLISRQAKIKKPDRVKNFEISVGYYEEVLFRVEINRSVISDFIFGRIHSEAF